MAKINYIKIAKKSAGIQIRELKKINKVFNKSFVKAVDALANCKGKVICAGVGKSGLIARKVSATLSSIGVSSFFCDPGTARHGDMGQIEKKDILLIFSYSGNSEELSDMLNYANRFSIRVIGIASSKSSILLKASDIKLLLPKVKEADITSIVPTSSTTITLVLGDSLCAAIQHKKKFSKENNIDRNKFIILLPGRLTPWKGQKIFIESIKLLAEKNDIPPFEAIILGSDQGRNVYKKQLLVLTQQHRLGKIIKFIDECKEMPVAYGVANLVCSSSIEPEAFGRVSVEAQSMQIPIIASDIGGSKETVLDGKTGFLFKNKDPNSLADVIAMVMKKDYNSLKSIGFEGRKNVLKRFDVDKMCQTTFTEYKKLIKLSS